MTEVNLSVNLDRLFVDSEEMDGDPSTVRDIMRATVVEAAAEKLVALLLSQWGIADLRETVEHRRAELIRDRLAVEVEAAFSEPVQRTTRWGETKGEPVTIREMIRQNLEAFLTGKPSDFVRKGRYDETPVNLAQLVGKIANEQMTREMTKPIQEARELVMKEVRVVITEAITNKLTKVIK